ncbi:MAG: hypothetical protein ABSB67_22540 [Bryobacteraceae bacterium]
MPLPSPLTSRWMKAAVFLVCLIPAVLLYWRWDHHLLGPNWVEKAQHFTGDWILRFLASIGVKCGAILPGGRFTFSV